MGGWLAHHCSALDAMPGEGGRGGGRVGGRGRNRIAFRCHLSVACLKHQMMVLSIQPKEENNNHVMIVAIWVLIRDVRCRALTIEGRGKDENPWGGAKKGGNQLISTKVRKLFNNIILRYLLCNMMF